MCFNLTTHIWTIDRLNSLSQVQVEIQGRLVHDQLSWISYKKQNWIRSLKEINVKYHKQSTEQLSRSHYSFSVLQVQQQQFIHFKIGEEKITEN